MKTYKRRKAYVIGIIFLIFILTAGCTTNNEKVSGQTISPIDRIYNLDPQRKLIGEETGDFHFVNMLTNKQVHFDEVNKDKVIMVQSFSVGCPACARGIADYNKLYDQYDIEVIYMDISSEDTLEDIKAIKEQYDGRDWIWASYQGSLLPFYEKHSFYANDMTLIIDKGGKIVYADSFSVPLDRLENELKKLGV